ncbi:hypothetical protein ACFQS1_31700 [Paractinoplanes rhizophilus]|uniref:Uncharacterized protein n=1 Tax=Paractinoplanes rhizophilus TaxID=1416877 RepID=A0ABW2I104_9ACTN
MTDDPIDRDLAEMAGNPRVAAEIKHHLQRLSRGVGGPELAEMASDLLDGRTSLREVGKSEVYADQFAAATRRFLNWYNELTPEECEELNRKAQEEFGVDEG